MITVERIENVQEFLFERLEDDLAERKEHDWYLTGRDIQQYIQGLKTLEEYKGRIGWKPVPLPHWTAVLKNDNVKLNSRL